MKAAEDDAYAGPLLRAMYEEWWNHIMWGCNMSLLLFPFYSNILNILAKQTISKPRMPVWFSEKPMDLLLLLWVHLSHWVSPSHTYWAPPTHRASIYSLRVNLYDTLPLLPPIYSQQTNIIPFLGSRSLTSPCPTWMVCIAKFYYYPILIKSPVDSLQAASWVGDELQPGPSSYYYMGPYNDWSTIFDSDSGLWGK